MSICTICKEAKPLADFYLRNNKKDRAPRPECVKCTSKANSKWKRDNEALRKLQWLMYSGKNKEIIKQKNSTWKKNNKAKVLAATRARQASKILRTPKWLTEDQKQQILSIYEEAVQLGSMYSTKLHVDHIYPLQGKDVSGLHVPWNLQILPAKDNARKGNRI